MPAIRRLSYRHASANAGFTAMLRVQPFGQAGDSIMNIRDANKVDAQRCGRILYDAFTNLAEKHNFPPDFPSPEVATGLASMLIGDRGFYGVIAEEAGTIVGSNFMDERSTIFGIGPISDDHRPIQRTCRCLFTVDSVLKTIDQEVDGRGSLWHLLASPILRIRLS